ncbi:MAG: branched-chain amino acid ABC transporter permease [Desulfatiglans sp.]|jgi:branched-chain amino acid transport system permease protein|nr:branched-chain amino acid ABC transporter permease [Thermodesulfobacteriota bacterium]MEE4353672.1 branched-chain amino acid ABC transporter permease [Desulfatiglans sp.]
MDQFLGLTLTGVMNGCLYALVAASIVLVYKATHVVSLAHGQLMTVIALFFWYCLVPWSLPLWLALPLMIIVAVVIGLMVNGFAMRPMIGQSSFSAFLVTFGIFIAISGFVQMNLKGVSKGLPTFLPSWSVELADVHLSSVHLFSFAVTIIIFLGLAILFKFTTIGLGMRGTSENHQLAQSTGIGVDRIFAFIWILSTIVSAVAGISLAIIMDIQYELPFLGIKGLIVALFGGLESLLGAVIAGVLLGLLETFAAGYLDPFVGGGLKDVAAYIALLILLWVKPYGLFGLVKIERI